jgi:hypothetical protein
MAALVIYDVACLTLSNDLRKLGLLMYIPPVPPCFKQNGMVNWNRLPISFLVAQLPFYESSHRGVMMVMLKKIWEFRAILT